MDRVWDSSKHPPKPLATSCQLKAIRGLEVSMYIFGLCGAIYCYGQNFVKNAKMALTLFERPSGRENLRIAKMPKPAGMA